jgi:ATP-dependent Clp protease ATP-binding subunit ClpA
VERYLEDPLAEEILKGSLQANEAITVVVEEGKLAFKQKATDTPKALSS